MGGGVAYDNVMTLIEAVETFNEAIAASSENSVILWTLLVRILI